jgi:hypothetical protein
MNGRKPNSISRRKTMNQHHVPTCVQLDEVVDPDYYVDLMLEGHLPLQDCTPVDLGEAPAER